MQKSFVHLDHLVAYFTEGIKSEPHQKIGIECEWLLFDKVTKMPLSQQYSQPQFQGLIHELMTFGWEKHVSLDTKNNHTLFRNGATLSFEAGGQIEYSSAATQSLAELFAALQTFWDELITILKRIHLGILPVAYFPLWSGDQLQKWHDLSGRFAHMRELLMQTGTHGLNVLLNTSSLQISLDYYSEQDMIRKIRLTQAIQPILMSLTNNSPFSAGTLTHYHSYRNYAWLQTDDNRCGVIANAWDDQFSFAHYADFVASFPLYYILKNNLIYEANGQSFKEFMQGKLASLPDITPNLQDWENHLTTIYHFVRMKQRIELRGFDMMPLPYAIAIIGVVTAIYYDATSLSQAEHLVDDLDVSEINQLYNQVCREGGKARLANGRTIYDYAEQLLQIAQSGLLHLKSSYAANLDIETLLKPLFMVCHAQQSLAEQWQERFLTLGASKTFDELYTNFSEPTVYA